MRRYNYLEKDIRNVLTRLSANAQDVPALIALLKAERTTDPDFWYVVT